MEREQILDSFTNKKVKYLEVALRMVGLNLGYKYTELLYNLLDHTNEISSGEFTLDKSVTIVYNWEAYWAIHDEQLNKLKNKPKDNDVSNTTD